MKFGFIGAGNMGGALARALKGKGELYISDFIPEKAASLAKELGGTACDNREAAQKADYLFLGVKPYMAKEVLGGIKDELANRAAPPVLVSMLAGTAISALEQILGFEMPIIRIMPNIPASSGNGMIMYAANEKATSEQVRSFVAAMDKSGQLLPMQEKLIDAGSAVSGCGPAFVALFIEALADGGVACGLTRADALKLAEATVCGTAAHMLSCGIQPGPMKDAVCSPGGTTIQGVRALEEMGFRAAAMNAVIKAYEKTVK
ncbi:MAG: pyrroline-5-carboxylate reductase [Clostridia bacterium]|nr:pyrroline-5-carboxylate reductase [Clostridia bacterium]